MSEVQDETSAAGERQAAEALPPLIPPSLLVWLRDFSVAGLVVLLIGVFLVQPFRVDGSSMEPLLSDGERILVNKLVHRLKDIERGEVVVLRSPAGQTLVKRVVGLPGDELLIRAGVVSVNGRVLEQLYVEESRATHESTEPVRLAADEYFVLGDNRAVSHDSRSFGVVGRAAIRGRASLRYWPPSTVGRLPPPNGG